MEIHGLQVKNQYVQNIGAIRVINSKLTLKNSSFDSYQTQGDREWLRRPDREKWHSQKGLPEEGGHLHVAEGSELVSESNKYANSRSTVGGCVALEGQARATFKKDRFTGCSAVRGGAIYAADFFHLGIDDSQFEKNIAYSG